MNDISPTPILLVNRQPIGFQGVFLCLLVWKIQMNHFNVLIANPELPHHYNYPAIKSLGKQSKGALVIESTGLGRCIWKKAVYISWRFYMSKRKKEDILPSVLSCLMDHWSNLLLKSIWLRTSQVLKKSRYVVQIE